MSTIREQMEVTARPVFAARRARMQAATGVRTQVADLLSTYQSDRQAMASAMRFSLEHGRRSRVETCRAETADTQRMIHAFHQTRMLAARRQRAALRTDRKKRFQTVAALVKEWRRSHRLNAQQQDKNLKNFVRDTHMEGENMLKTARTWCRETGRDMAEKRQQATAAIRSRTSDIETEARNLVTHFAMTRRNMARQLERRLASGVQDRRQAVASLLGGFRSEAGEKKKPAKREMAGMSHQEQHMEILEVIHRHPEGVSAAQIGRLLGGLSALQAGRLATELAESGKVRKDEATRCYFP